MAERDTNPVNTGGTSEPSASEGGPGPRLRPAVGAIVLEREGRRVLIGRRNDSVRPHWQLPQGGIRPGEDPEEAVRRELTEEIGTDRVTILGVLPHRTRYVWSAPNTAAPDTPGPPRSGSATSYDGQSHVWFVLRLEGELEERRRSEEFSSFAWIPPETLLSETHPVRRRTYAVVEEMLRAWLDQRGLS